MMRVAAVAAISLAAAACATPQTDALRRDPGALPASVEISDAVFFSQRTRECGPAALAMALTRSGVPVTPDALVDAVYNPGREGSLAPAVLAAARRAGRIAYPIRSLPDLFAELERRRPVIVLQNLGLEWAPQWHYAVAVGYDLPRETMILHSGRTAFLRMSLATFERTWERGEFWGLTVLRPGEYPDGADPLTYARAVAGVARAGHAQLAADAYADAVGRWPDDFYLRLALGNARYGLGDREGAAAAYREAARRHPGRADAHNNLAHVLGELGRFDAAERAALRAVELGGENAALYRETLREIRAKARAAAK